MKINVCIGSSCHLKGSRQVVTTLQKLVKINNLEDSINLSGKFCMGNCQNGVSVQCGSSFLSLNEDNVENEFKNEILTKLK